MTRNYVVLIALGAVLIAAGLRAQPSDKLPSFEVASIKLNTSGDLESHIFRSATGLTVTNMPARELIRFAYLPRQPFQLVGGPSWIGTDRFDMVAKIEGPAPLPTLPGVEPDAFMLAMRTLLADRFQLKVHHEQREMDIYALVLAKPVNGPGAGLKHSTTDCEALVYAATRGGLTQPAPGTPVCGLWGTAGQIRMGGFPLSLLANALSRMTGRFVADRTGLAGNWDLTLSYAAEQRGQLPADLPAVDPSATPIFTALQEQLGLKLESTKGLVDILVIDQVEKPTPD
jgi:uncharacterized protein (TIGR03435 family)